MTLTSSHLWIVAPYQSDRNISVYSLISKEQVWYHIDCHQNLGGPYTGVCALVRNLVSEIFPDYPDHIIKYAKAILRVVPELRSLLTNSTDTLTESANVEERLRFYGGNQSDYIANSLTSFVLACTSLANRAPRTFIFDNVQGADPLDQQFLAVLLRRANPSSLSVVICTAMDTVEPALQTALAQYTTCIHPDPLTQEEGIQIGKSYRIPDVWIQQLLQYGVEWRGQWKAFGERRSVLVAVEPSGASLLECIQFLLSHFPSDLQSSLVLYYIQSVCTSDDLLASYAYEQASPALKQHLHHEQAHDLEASEHEKWDLGAIPYHYERGRSPATFGVQTLLYATHICFARGFYEAAIGLGQRGRQLVDPVHDLEYYWEFTKDIAQSLAVLQHTREAEGLYKEIRALTSDSAIHIRISYAMAMHYTRFSPPEKRDHTIAKGWIQQALALIQSLPPGTQKTLEIAFHLNALALIEMHLGRRQEALQLVQDAISYMEEISHEQFVLYRTVLLGNRGQLYVYLERWEQALADFAEVIRLDPNYEETYFKRAKLYHQLERYEEALQDYTTGIAHSLVSAEIFAGRASILLLLGRDEEALVDYTAALDINPSFTDALLHRAEIYRQRGQYDNALRDYTTGIANGTLSFELFYNRAHLLDAMGRAEEALADYISALQIQPTAINAILNRATILYERESYEAAQEEVERGLQIAVDHPQLLCIRALVESATGSNEQAYQTFTRALEQDRLLLEAWVNRAIVAYNMGLVDSAITDISQALLLEENVIILSNRANAYQAQQKWKEAIADYTRCIELTQEKPEEQQEWIEQRTRCLLHAGMV